MKKIICALLILAMTVAFAACSTKECDFCHEKDSGREVKYYGETLWICEDCDEDIEDLSDMLENFEK